jgi:hypothetical protein
MQRCRKRLRGDTTTFLPTVRRFHDGSTVFHAGSVNDNKGSGRPSLSTSARNGPVCAGVPYRNLFLFLNFIPAVINVYYINLSVFLKVLLHI